ncbi:retrovirus-related pol polyprotein from transposon TNT 1-94 [Tanacetum coccineum]
MQQPMPNPEYITDPIAAMNMALVLMAKAFKLNYSTPTNNNHRISSNPRNRQIAQQGMILGKIIICSWRNWGESVRQFAGIVCIGHQVVQNAIQNPSVQNDINKNEVTVVPGIANQNQNGNVVAARAEGNANRNNGNQIRCYNCRELGHLSRNCTVRPRRRDAAYLQTQLLMAQKEEAGIQLQAEEFDLMTAAADLDEIEEVNANFILMANLQQASTSVTQTNTASVYDSDGYVEVYVLLEPIPEPHQVHKNDSNVISEVSSVEQGGGTIEQHSTNVEETRAYHESLFHNLAAEVEKCKIRIQFLKVAPKFVRDFQSLANEADESLAKHKALELEIERLLRAVVSQDIMSIVQNNSVVDSSNLQTELECMKERFEKCIIKKENEYAKLWNDWYKINVDQDCTSMTKFHYDKALTMTCTKDRTTLNLRRRFRVSGTNKLHDTIYENAKLRAQLFDKVSEQKDTFNGVRLNYYDQEGHSLGEIQKNDRTFSAFKSLVVRRISCFFRIPRGVDLLKEIYNKPLHQSISMNLASASPICLLARDTSTKSLGLWLHLLHMNLCGPMRIASINGKQYVLVIVDDYSRYTWVIFLRSKNEAPEEIKTFLKKIIVLLHALVIIVTTDNGTEFKNQLLQEYFNSVGISHQASSVCTPQQNGAKAIATACYTQNRSIIHRRFDKTPYELINGRKPAISFLHVFGALCYPKNDREDIGKLGAKAMVFEQSSLKPGLQSMNFGQISSGLDLPYAPSTITTQRPTKAALRTVSAAQAPQVLQTPTASTTTANTAPTPTNSFSQATSILNTSQNVDELETQQLHSQRHPATIADNVPNAMFDDNTFVNPFATPSTSVAESSSS